MDAGKTPTTANRLVELLIMSAVILFVLFALSMFLANSQLAWPIQKEIERSKIYSASRARVQAAGGWRAIQQVCLNYATNGFKESTSDILYYFRGRRLSTNSLPKALDVIQPMFVQLGRDTNGVPVFQVILSVGHRTGTYPTPYYGIWVLCTNRPDYVPVFGSANRGAQGIVERKGEAIFEAR